MGKYNLSAPNCIELKNSAYMNLLRAVLESASCEPTGFLFGYKSGDKCIFVNAYPVISAERTPTSVSYGNLNAIARVRNFHNFMHKLGSRETKWIGGFHSHPYKAGNSLSALTQLSKDDLEFIQNEMKAHKKDYWIEVIARFKEKKAMNKWKTGKRIRFLKNKASIIIADTQYHKYKIILSAYLVLKKGIEKYSNSGAKGINKENRSMLNVREIKIKIR